MILSHDANPGRIEFSGRTGLGEPGTTVVGPAIGNAIFAARRGTSAALAYPSGNGAAVTHSAELSCPNGLAGTWQTTFAPLGTLVLLRQEGLGSVDARRLLPRTIGLNIRTIALYRPQRNRRADHRSAM
jgi:hypothetical protein